MRFPIAVRRLLLGYLILHLLAVGVFVLVLTRITRNQMVADEQTRMESMAVMLASYLDQLDTGANNTDLPAVLKKLGAETHVRLTVLNQDGDVIADSETGTKNIGPHGTRQEILQAKAIGSSFSQRYSSTLDQPMMYFAAAYQPANPDHIGGFIRVAIPAVAMNAAILAMQKLIWLFAGLMSVLIAILMVAFSARSMQPLNAFSAAVRSVGTGHYHRTPELTQRQDEWGQLATAFEKMQDEITRREEALLENSERLEAVLSSMIEGVISIDSQGNVMLANEAACRMFSLSSNELQGRQLMDIVRIPELQEAIRWTQLQRTFSKTEFLTLAEPKRRLSARVAVLAKRPERGIAVVLHDVTELRQLETMRQDFVANVSHELKTPLSSIKAYAETLKMGALYNNEKNMHFVERIESQAEQLERQIQDLLELARVESGNAAFRITRVSINEICEVSVRQFTTHAEKSQVRLQIEPSDQTPFVRVDKQAMETIVKNLVLNAIHYTPAGGLVTIQTAVELDVAVIRVIDTGIGIAADQQGRVFERFYRVDRARSRDKGGTGLGLSIVKHLVQAFEGSVHLESQIGKGSKFQVRLPRAE